ncbi:metallothionein expression activator [Zygosaccharomyces mellis]|uniref:Metallothionein expression activator n=1 Tax=Zygosaccharomyces mellis TaxID=42258 RepID=A0A4C2E464_9SACH|nr:metallothionein expression activator [Zygosaccharomyces mellis]
MALEKQQEVNKKLEEQLEANRIQQEHLQRVLGGQDVAGHKFASSEDASPQSAIKTPANNGKNTSVIGDDGNIIITSNSNNGGYKFPPPTTLDPPAFGPGSQTAMNGSPSRKPSRNRTSPLNDDWRENGDEDVAMENYLKPEVEQKHVADSSHFLEKRNAQAGFNDSFLTHDQARSPVNVRPVTHHDKKESTISTVSTIPQHLDDNENSDSEFGELLGLGIQSMNGKRASPRNYALRPPPIDIMPSIPGSTNNTPVAKQPQLPQKHTFQHTPVKNQHTPVKNPQPPSQQLTQGYYSNAGISTGSVTGLSENPFRDPIATPQLKPPSVHSSRRNSGCSTDFNEIIGEHKSGFNGEGQLRESGDEPESRFIVAKTPSPVLKSQSRFEGSSPQCDSANVSPLKITRKPTTLPRGSIDKYVKELPDKLFECQYHGCGKIFKRRYNIRSHIQTHLEDRPYVCDFEGCDKAFVRNHDLVRHKKSHAEKCYACPCGKKFNREDALIVHRSRMICSGGKRYENVVIKKSPRRRGRPKKDGYSSTQSSPVKENIERSNDGYLIYKMEEQLRNEMEEYGLLRPPPNLAVTNHALLLSPSPSSDNSDMGSPKYELKEPEKKT